MICAVNLEVELPTSILRRNIVHHPVRTPQDLPIHYNIFYPAYTHLSPPHIRKVLVVWLYMFLVERIIQHTCKAVNVRKDHLGDYIVIREVGEMWAGDLGKDWTGSAVVVCHRESQNAILFHLRTGKWCVLFEHVLAIFFIAQASLLVAEDGQAQ